MQTSEENRANLHLTTVHTAQEFCEKQRNSFETVIADMKLKHVTASDFFAFILVYFQLPSEDGNGEEEGKDEEEENTNN